jgi:hypothetical protein
MPKSYSQDLRERVIEAIEMGASRREAADCFDVSVSSDPSAIAVEYGLDKKAGCHGASPHPPFAAGEQVLAAVALIITQSVAA